jgi:ATP-binding cassette subfamily B multidrug efflux pump
MRVDTGWNAAVVALNAALLASVFAMSVVLWNRGALPVGTVVVAVSLVYRLQGVAFALQGASQQIFQSIGQITEGAKSLARPLPDPPTGGWRDEPVPTEAVAIALKNVEFGYRPEEPVIHGLDLDVAAGEKVGIVGPSGGGKTTLIRLVAGLLVPDQGSVTLERREVRDIPEDQRRALISVVAQDVALFNRSIRENITYGLANAADEDVWRALQRAQAAKFVPGVTDDDGRKGLDAVVGERGSSLSAGQRQRIAIARALIRETPILIMDEASSALDSRTEEALQQELDSHMSGKTVLAVAHRLSTVAKMDRIIVVEDGRITDQGKHDELIARGGTYAELWSLQAHQQTAGLS